VGATVRDWPKIRDREIIGLPTDLLLDLVEAIGSVLVLRGVLKLRLPSDERCGDGSAYDDGAEHGGEEWADR
jgi:hypothetical protein